VLWDEDHGLTVKVAFLAQVREYKTVDSDETFSENIESPRLSVQLFDRWWSIRASWWTKIRGGFRPLIKQLRHLIGPSCNNRVVEWVDWVSSGKWATAARYVDGFSHRFTSP
jgi:hypothetical protein